MKGALKSLQVGILITRVNRDAECLQQTKQQFFQVKQHQNSL